MRVMIFLPIMGLRGEQVPEDWIQPHNLQSKQDQGVVEINKLFPHGLLENARLNPHVISTVVSNGCHCVKARFTYVADTRELISNSIYVESATICADREWSFCWGEKSGKVNPIEECKMAQDKARYVNEASRIFVRMRDLLSRGLKIVYSGQINEVEYVLDSLGRYEVTNFNELPIAASYAIACNAIF